MKCVVVFPGPVSQHVLVEKPVGVTAKDVVRTRHVFDMLHGEPRPRTGVMLSTRAHH